MVSAEGKFGLAILEAFAVWNAAGFDNEFTDMGPVC